MTSQTVTISGVAYTVAPLSRQQFDQARARGHALGRAAGKDAALQVAGTVLAAMLRSPADATKAAFADSKALLAAMTKDQIVTAIGNV